MKTPQHIKMLIAAMSEGIYEKDHIMSLTLLSAVAGESVFLLGPPGTAKSLVARRLKMAFSGGRSFEYLMSRFSTPDEIFGPVSISLLKNEDRYERVVDGFLPSATVVFLDEIWKAGPSIQNALLTAINERIFQNGRETLHLPMKVLIAASNELPAEGEGLEALWDRFLVRLVSNCIQNETTFFKMIRSRPAEQASIADKLLITNELYAQWQRDIEQVAIPDEVCACVSHIRRRLAEEGKKEGIGPMDYYTSDRRWRKAFRLLQTSAMLNGREAVDATDVPLLMHCLWNKAETIATIIDIVTESLTAGINTQLDRMVREAEKTLRNASTPKKEKDKLPQTDNRVFRLVNQFYYDLKDYPDGHCLLYKWDYNNLSATRNTDALLYRDHDKQAWVIHAIYSGAPMMNAQPSSGSEVRKVKLRQCKGGIIVDGTPYALNGFITQGETGAETATSNTPVDNALIVISSQLQPKLQALHEAFSAGKHLFLSPDDLALVNHKLKLCDKHLAEAEVKLQNTSQLL